MFHVLLRCSVAVRDGFFAVLRAVGDVVVGTRPHVALHLPGLDGLHDNLQDHVRPYQVQHQKRYKQRVEDVVDGVHREDLRGFDARAVDDARVKSESRHDPSDREKAENDVAGFLQVRVFQELRSLKQNVRAVMHKQNQRPDAM